MGCSRGAGLYWITAYISTAALLFASLLLLMKFILRNFTMEIRLRGNLFLVIHFKMVKISIAMAMVDYRRTGT